MSVTKDFIWVTLLLSIVFPLLAAHKSQTNSDISYFIPADTNTQQPAPSPDLSPQEVVTIQLKALQANGIDNKGIELTFNFAAPANRAYTGPLEKFKQMVKNAVYQPMLNFKKFEANKIYIAGNEAQQIVIITDKNGKKAAFLFSLSKQTEGLYKGCWMTDSVIRLAYEEKLVKA